MPRRVCHFHTSIVSRTILEVAQFLVLSSLNFYRKQAHITALKISPFSVWLLCSNQQHSPCSFFFPPHFEEITSLRRRKLLTAKGRARNLAASVGMYIYICGEILRVYFLACQSEQSFLRFLSNLAQLFADAGASAAHQYRGLFLPAAPATAYKSPVPLAAV